jgi:hypothetical protein
VQNVRTSQNQQLATALDMRTKNPRVGWQVGTSLLFVFQHVGITVPQKSGCRAEFVPEISNLPAYTGTPRDD